jgi:hypothetical protein
VSWPKTLAEALEPRILRTPILDCWLWTGSHRSGYGRVSLHHRWYAAHRVSWELANGPVPDGLVLDHLCRNELCVRPAHLVPASIAENSLRGLGRNFLAFHGEACWRGHPLPKDRPRYANGRRKNCSECVAERDQAAKVARAAA